MPKNKNASKKAKQQQKKKANNSAVEQTVEPKIAKLESDQQHADESDMEGKKDEPMSLPKVNPSMGQMIDSIPVNVNVNVDDEDNEPAKMIVSPSHEVVTSLKIRAPRIEDDPQVEDRPKVTLCQNGEKNDEFDELDTKHNEPVLNQIQELDPDQDLEPDQDHDQKYSSDSFTNAYFSEPMIEILQSKDPKTEHVRSIFKGKNPRECMLCGKSNKDTKLVTLGGIAGWIYCKKCGDDQSIKKAVLDRIGDNNSVPMLWLNNECLLKYDHRIKHEQKVVTRHGWVNWDDGGFIDHQQRKFSYLPMMQDYTMILRIESKTDPKAEDLQTVTLTNLLVNNKNLYEEFVTCKNLMASPNIVIGYDELPIHIKTMVENARAVALAKPTERMYKY